ncbi:hypothetical protein M8C21_022128, partial [Ambrosia artemisiifolia]
MMSRNFNLNPLTTNAILLVASGEKTGGYTITNMVWDLMQARNIVPSLPACQAYYNGLRRQILWSKGYHEHECLGTEDTTERVCLSQIWILGGSFGEDLKSIESGWQVSPDLYVDNNTRLFTYWTSDAYQATGCYNLICSGFIQINNPLFLHIGMHNMISQPGQDDVALRKNLEECNVVISQDLVTKVHSRVRNDWKAAFTFFQWAGKQRAYTHSYREYHCVIAVLGKMRRSGSITRGFSGEFGQFQILPGTCEAFCVMANKFSAAAMPKSGALKPSAADDEDMDPTVADVTRDPDWSWKKQPNTAEEVVQLQGLLSALQQTCFKSGAYFWRWDGDTQGSFSVAVQFHP